MYILGAFGVSSNDLFLYSNPDIANMGFQFVRWFIGFGYGARCEGSALLAVVATGRRWARGLINSEAVQLLRCSHTISYMKDQANPHKLTRAQLSQALDSVPVSHLLGKSASRELTGKQKRFALEVAKGSSGAEAYRTSYNTKASPKIQGDAAYKLKARPEIAQEIGALQLAIAAQEYQTPAALRSLVIHSLVRVITNPDSKPGQITAAAKVLGTVTEVAAFTERKEVRTITSSEDARARIMAELKQLTAADVQDVTPLDDADALMREISGQGDTHPPPEPTTVDLASAGYIHTIPLERSPLELDHENVPTENPPPSLTETPPVKFEK